MQEVRHQITTSSTLSPSKSFYCASLALGCVVEDKPAYFRFKNRLYKMEKTEKQVRIAKISNNYYNQKTSDIHYKVTRISRLNLLERFRGRGAHKIEKLPKHTIPIDKPCSLTNYLENPYTQLAEEAFLQYEEDWSQQDRASKKSYAIALIDGNLQLVNRDKIFDHLSEDDARVTLNLFTEEFIKNFGKDRLDYICHRYGIVLDEEAYLTPEIVYRLNIGLGKCEYSDILSLGTQLNEMSENLVHCNEEESLQKLYDANIIPAHSFKGLLREIAQELDINIENVTVKDFQDWKLRHIPENFEEITMEKFDLLQKIFYLTEEEIRSHYTKRKIEGLVTGYYTKASRQIYKPWVDEQELTQLREGLKNSADYQEGTNALAWQAYCEKISHVLVKKNLFNTSPSGEWRLGELIPAPHDTDGNPRWYIVKSMINNSAGAVTYTLEPACRDASLPVIKICRSTASDPYAFDGKASVLSDINPINSPGYEGRIFADQYERSFFDSRTIPIWVAYLEQAQVNINDEEKAQELLAKAIDELDKTTLPKTKKLYELIQENDNAFLQLLHDPRLKSEEKKCLEKIYFKVCDKRQRPEAVDFQTIHDAHSIVEIIGDIYVQPSNKMKKLSNELKHYLKIKNSPVKTNLDIIEKEISNIDSLNEKIQALYNYAKEMGETSAQKKDQSILVAGHSLGGAIAQRLMAQYSLISGRVPLLGCTMQVFDFAAPGINEEDNAAFINTGNEHAELLTQRSQELLQGQQRIFQIHRCQASGDCFPLGGKRHLGSASAQEEEEMKAWLEFDAVLVKRNINYELISSNLLGSAAAHAAQVLNPATIKDRIYWKNLPKIAPPPLEEDQGESVAEEDNIDENDYLSIFYRYRPSDQRIVDGGDTSRNQRRILRDHWQLDKGFIKLKQWDYNTTSPRRFARKLAHATKDTQESPLYGDWKSERDPFDVFAIELETSTNSVKILSQRKMKKSI